ncbi:MAG: Ig-like domain-containing protein, partial [Bifidobacteriaceae bacterium]|nr:Ig-like domain-containing protein [Bifidobacteriaceae bacterium]
GVAAQSWLVQPDNSLVADAVTAAVVVARVNDAKDNPVSAGTVVFEVPDGLTATWQGQTVKGPDMLEAELTDGSAAVSFTSDRSGSYAVTARLKDGAAISAVHKASDGAVLRADGRVELEYAPGAVSGETSTLAIVTGDLAKVVGSGETHRAEVQVKDAKGNPVAGRQVVFESAEGTADGPQAGAWQRGATTASDAVGSAAFEFSPPDNRAGWIWVRAFIDTDSGRLAVGGAQTSPAPAQQTTLRAEFVAGRVSQTDTQATFEAYSAEVANDGESRSWARVQVMDAFGNPVPGAKVAFVLPTSQAGTVGTPVFAGQGVSEGAKTVEVVTCPVVPAAPAQTACLRGGVYTPGLATAWIVSQFEGSFEVSAQVATESGNVAAGNGTVRFAAGTASSNHSWFTLEPTGGAALVRADGIGSYTLTATVMNGGQGNGALPVSGACVTPELAAGLNVKTAPSEGCAAGGYRSGSDGKVRLGIVSTLAGRWPVGVSLGGSAIPAKDTGGAVSLEAIFAGGLPSAAKSELTSPAGPVRADDPAGQPVALTIRDEAGNLAECVDAAGTPIGCGGTLMVPAGAWVGLGSTRVTGPAAVTVTAGAVDYARGVSPEAGVARVVYFAGEGSYQVNAQVNGVDVTIADGVAVVGGPAWASVAFTDATPPGSPLVRPSAGDVVAGEARSADRPDAARGDLTVQAKDVDGRLLAACPVGGDGAFRCAVEPVRADGSVVDVVLADRAGNISAPTRITVDARRPDEPAPAPTDGEELAGLADAAGDQIAVKAGDGAVLCETSVRQDKTWSCQLSPAAAEGDMLTVVETAPNERQSERLWRVGVPRIAVAQETVTAGGEQVAVGENFQPGELISAGMAPVSVVVVSGRMAVAEEATASSVTPAAARAGVAKGAVAGEIEVGQVAASGDGQVSFQWSVSAATPAGQYNLKLTGELSGSSGAAFTVTAPATVIPAPAEPAPPVVARPAPPVVAGGLPFTGSGGTVGLAGAALGAVLAGWLLLAAARRRRQGVPDGSTPVALARREL